MAPPKALIDSIAAILKLSTSNHGRLFTFLKSEFELLPLRVNDRVRFHSREQEFAHCPGLCNLHVQHLRAYRCKVMV